MRGLPKKVKDALEKAQDSALLAVEVYNKPAIKFKSGGYITLMVIAWTALFHAVFFKRKLKPCYKKPNGHFETIDGDFKYWELGTCLKEYFGSDTGDPIRKNLEFFIPLRNRVEHRSLPELDSCIFGECQAMLLNFDTILETEFGAKYCLRESLSFALQLFPSTTSLADAVKHKPETKSIVDFINNFRSSVSADITMSGKYSFKAFLIQVANHKGKDVLPIQFIHYDKLSDEDKKQVEGIAALVKFKDVPVANLDTFRVGVVVGKVQIALGNPKRMCGAKEVDKFNASTHTNCWKRYKVRPDGKSSSPKETNSTYCIYDKRHNDYGYTQAWIDFLILKLIDPAEFDAVCKNKTVVNV